LSDFKVKYSNTIAIVLCGGKSDRMGSPKAFLHYHGIPQYKYLTNLLKNIFQSVIISANIDQKGEFDYTEIVYDDASFGPMSGLISVSKLDQTKDYFLLGCDYPLLHINDITNIMDHAQEGDIICYKKNNHIEPLVTLYKQSILTSLFDFAKENQSLNQFIKSQNYHTLTPLDNNRIISIDHQESYKKIQNEIKN
jgi:molybdenum cofactor guanylyltransferase